MRSTLLSLSLLTVIITLASAQCCFSQQRTLVGINGNAGIERAYRQPSLGLTIERQFSKHSGIETGLFYKTRNFRVSGTITDSTGPYFFGFTIVESHLILPVLYKYYSRFANFSAGPTVEYYIGYRAKNQTAGLVVNDADRDPKYRFGFQGKIGKMINLSKDFLIEPELRYNSDQHLGIGVGLKYKL